MSIISIVLEGSVEGYLNLKHYRLAPSSVLLCLPGQTIQCQYVSDDFKSLFMVMSTDFENAIKQQIPDPLSIFLKINSNPILHFGDEEFEAMMDCFRLIQSTIRRGNHNYMRESIMHLIMAFFYAFQSFGEKTDLHSDKLRTRKEELMNLFYKAVSTNFREQRSVDFYANELCITPKYLSSVIKEVSNKTASEWIIDFVILEAKAQLKSTNRTIQEISEDLRFANQSFFSKYFKHYTGLSPKDYRNS